MGRELIVWLLLLACRPAQSPAAVAPAPTTTLEGGLRRVGFVAEARQPLPATLENLRRIAEEFQAAKVDLVVALGCMGPTDQDLRAAYRVIKAAGVPVAALAGRTEDIESFKAATAATGVVNLAATPIVYAREGGILVRGGVDLAAVEAAIGKSRGPIVVVGHLPPRGSGLHAIDRIWGGSHGGSPETKELIRRLGARFGAFSHLEESSTGATDLTGARVVEASAWSDELFLNVGPADSVEHTKLTGTSGSGEAAILEIAGRKARWHLIMPRAAQ